MPYNNDLEFKLAQWKDQDRISNDTEAATRSVTNILNLAWVAAMQIFAERATPQVALEIFDRIQSETWRIERRRNPRVRFHRRREDTESTQ